jgi:hypothetical protein
MKTPMARYAIDPSSKARGVPRSISASREEAAVGTPEVEVRSDLARHFLAQKLVGCLTGDAPNQLAHQEGMGHAVVAARGSGLPPGRLRGQLCHGASCFPVPFLFRLLSRTRRADQVGPQALEPWIDGLKDHDNTEE